MNKENDLCGIYYIKNKINNKIYIGSSIKVKARWGCHKSALRKNKHHCIHLQRGWIKYGENNFEFLLIEQCNKDIAEKELIAKEQAYLDSHHFDIKYNTNQIAGKPPVDIELSRRTAKNNWLTGKFRTNFKPFERIDPNTGEVKEYAVSAEYALREGFNPKSIYACCNAKNASYANYYWQFLDGSTPDYKFSYNKIFIKVQGVNLKDGSTLILTNFKECSYLGFDYRKIRACCEQQRGRRSHNGYKWYFVDEYMQNVASAKAAPTHTEVFCKRVVRETLDGLHVKFYESQAATKSDGFDQRKVSMCCLGKRKTHKGYRWRFA